MPDNHAMPSHVLRTIAYCWPMNLQVKHILQYPGGSPLCWDQTSIHRSSHGSSPVLSDYSCIRDEYSLYLPRNQGNILPVYHGSSLLRLQAGNKQSRASPHTVPIHVPNGSDQEGPPPSVQFHHNRIRHAARLHVHHPSTFHKAIYIYIESYYFFSYSPSLRHTVARSYSFPWHSSTKASVHKPDIHYDL